MRFLLDQDVYAATARFLVDEGHDVQTAAQLGLSRAPDLELLQVGQSQSRIFVTRDRDFGAIVFLQRRGPGVIYLRMLPSNINAVHVELLRVLARYSETELRSAFTVVEPGRHRLRRVA